MIEIDQITDADAFMKAVTATEPKATQSVGGRFVIRTTKPVAIDGGQPLTRFAVIAFDSEEKFKAWPSRNYSPVGNISDTGCIEE